MTVKMIVSSRVTLVTVLLSVITCDSRQDTRARVSLEATAVTEISSLVGSSVSLPCNMTSNTPGDKVKLVLWFREDKMTPVYSLDSRGKNVDLHHWLTKRFAWQINQRITTLIISQTLVTKSLCHSLKSVFRMTTPSRR